MFVVTEEDLIAVRTAFYRRGEFAAIVGLWERFPMIPDKMSARFYVRTIASWGAISVPRPVVEVPPPRPIRGG